MSIAVVSPVRWVVRVRVDRERWGRHRAVPGLSVLGRPNRSRCIQDRHSVRVEPERRVS